MFSRPLTAACHQARVRSGAWADPSDGSRDHRQRPRCSPYCV